MYENFDFDEDFEEEYPYSKDFEYVSTNGNIRNYSIYLSLKKINNGKLKLFNKWTNGWKTDSFVPISDEDMNNIVKSKNKLITFYDNGEWSSLGYNNFIKKYPQFEV